MNRIYPAVLALTLSVFSSFIAQTLKSQSFVPPPASNYVGDIKTKYRIIVKDIEARQIPLDQKLRLIEEEVNKLKNIFKKERAKEYEKIQLTDNVLHKCRSSTGKKKNCGWASVVSPSSDLYTKKEWIRVEGDSKGTAVTPDGSKASIKMTRAGSGENKGRLIATFRYKPASIVQLVDKDMIEVFNQVTTA